MARSNAIGKLREIVEAVSAGDEPKQLMLDKIGPIAEEMVLHSQVLVATYAGSKYHPGTQILKSDRALQEDQFQGTIGLVVKVGPGAFVDNPKMGAYFHGTVIAPGDWVLCRPSDGLALFIREVPCRLFEDVNIKMRVTQPEIYW